MKKLLLLAVLFSITLGASSQIVTAIKAEYHHGQTFVRWKAIPNYNYRFYFVYRYDSPITKDNFNNATYMGKVLENFSLNYFLNLGIFGGPIVKDTFYMVINNDPWTQLDSTDGFIALTCTKEKTYYYAVTADTTIGAEGVENKRMVPGSNAMITGITEHVAPIEAYLQVSGIPLEDNANLLYDGYCMFGTNQKTEFTPLMANEACLANNFGLIKDVDQSTPKNACTFFFYGGGGNAFDNANGTTVDGMWKVSMEDDLPNFNWDALGGENTKWIGYNENFDVYNANQFSAFPTTGIDRTYTIARVKWTLDWVKREFPNDIDTAQIAMQGSSNGCTGALTMAYLYPELISAVDVTNAKFNIQYLGDPNNKCKWNANGTSRNRANIYLGEQATNLQSDIPKIKDVGFYGLYDFANMNTLVQDNKYNSLPVIFVTSGKSDDVTCWDEKIPFYKTNQQNKTGSFFYWDLRSHKGGLHSIKDRPLELMLRFKTTLSYPAFSNCSANNDPGIITDLEQIYDGDTIGTINGALDWTDATIAETATSWQAVICERQFQLVDTTVWFPTVLPAYAKVDITPRRLQKFKNITDGSIICLENWENGILIQSKSITYHVNANGLGLMTFRKAKISKDSNLIKFYVCQSPKTTITNFSEVVTSANVYPNPTTDVTYIELSLAKDDDVIVSVTNILGNQVIFENRGMMIEGEYDLPVDLSKLAQGIYIVNITAGESSNSYRVVKQ